MESFLLTACWWLRVGDCVFWVQRCLLTPFSSACSFEHSHRQIEERICLFVRAQFTDRRTNILIRSRNSLFRPLKTGHFGKKCTCSIFFFQNIWSCQYFALSLQSKSRLEKCVEADKSRLEKCCKVYKSHLKKCVEARKSGLEKC